MTLVPTVAQMLTVIGVALLITIAVSGVVAYLMARLEQDAPVAHTGLHDDRMPVPAALPSQRPALHNEPKVHAGV